MEPKRITLFYSENGSDKTYQAQLEAAGDGFVVNCQWGRRGATLQTGTKTATPVPYDKALKIYTKIVAEKTGKGYTEDASGVAFQGQPQGDLVSGLLPQLLNDLPEEEVESYLSNPAWGMQEKFDGERRMIEITAGGARGINKKGLVVSLPASVAERCETGLPSGTILDGELIGERYVIFDILQFGQIDLRSEPVLDRYGHAIDAGRHTGLEVAEAAWLPDEKRRRFAELRNRNAEGVTFKQVSAPYVPGRPNSGGAQRKFKFYATATVVVTGITEGKRSIGMGMYASPDDASAGRVTDVGRCTIPANQDLPVAGAFAEVRYLYAYPNGGSLFQPTFLGIRNDQDVTDCLLSQLKYKPESAD